MRYTIRLPFIVSDAILLVFGKKKIHDLFHFHLLHCQLTESLFSHALSGCDI